MNEFDLFAFICKKTNPARIHVLLDLHHNQMFSSCNSRRTIFKFSKITY